MAKMASTSSSHHVDAAKATDSSDAHKKDDATVANKDEKKSGKKKACNCAKCNPPPVHPAARLIAGLMSTMSLRDQHAGASAVNTAFYIVTPLSFAVAMVLGKFWICVYSILGLGALSLLLFVPNLRQRPNVAVCPKTGTALDVCVSVEANERYYQAFNNVNGFLVDFSEDGRVGKNWRGQAAIAKRAEAASAETASTPATKSK